MEAASTVAGRPRPADTRWPTDEAHPQDTRGDHVSRHQRDAGEPVRLVAARANPPRRDGADQGAADCAGQGIGGRPQGAAGYLPGRAGAHRPADEYGQVHHAGASRRLLRLHHAD